MAPDPDAALMLAFQQGDEGAFRTLFERYAGTMVAFCHHFVRDSARAEELAQDVFVKLCRSAARYRPTARFRTFLYRIAANHCLNELRRAEWFARGEPGAGATDPDALPSGAPTPEASAQGRALERAVRELLARLPESQRAAFLHRLDLLAQMQHVRRNDQAVFSKVGRAVTAQRVDRFFDFQRIADGVTQRLIHVPDQRHHFTIQILADVHHRLR